MLWVRLYECLGIVMVNYCIIGEKMKCPYCDHEKTRVVDKRDRDNISRRRRECKSCEERFTTYERPDVELIVVKKDGGREKYDREKLKKGIMEACEKRPVSVDKVGEVVDRIEKKMRGEGKEVKSQKIGEEVMKELKKLDDIAYIRFASVYREFKDLSEFKDQIDEIK